MTFRLAFTYPIQGNRQTFLYGQSKCSTLWFGTERDKIKLAARSLVLSLSVLFCVHGHAAGGPAKLDIIPRCGLVGSWHCEITIPDGADGVSAALLRRFAPKGREVSVKVAANDKRSAVVN